jgi:hypothetical protein
MRFLHSFPDFFEIRTIPTVHLPGRFLARSAAVRGMRAAAAVLQRNALRPTVGTAFRQRGHDLDLNLTHKLHKLGLKVSPQSAILKNPEAGL